MRIQTEYATIASGDSLSGVISNLGAGLVGLFVSVPTSCVAYLKASYDVTSVNARRVQGFTTAVASGDFTWDIGSGSKVLAASEIIREFPYIRLETSVAMTATCSITVLTKF